MAEVVDSIVAELIARDNGYVATFDRATTAHERFVKSVPKVAGGLDLGGAEAQKYANRHKKAAGDVVIAEEQATEKVKRARKSRADSAVAADEKEVRSAKAAAKLKADAEIAEAERSARYRRLAEQAVASRSIPQSTSGRIGARFTPEPSGQRSIPASVVAGGAPEVVAEAEINHLMADRFDLAAKAKVAEGAVKRELQDQVEWLRRINAYKAAGLSEDQAILRAEAETLAVEKLRAAAAAKSSGGGLKSAARFAEGAGIGRAGGSGAAIGGIVAAAGVAAIVGMAKAGLDYAQSLKVVSDQLGITTHDLQRYQAVALTLGMTNEQLRESFGQLSNNLGRAQEGSEQQRKIFAALNIDIGNSRDGFKSLSDVLPTFLDRLSQIPDKAKRMAIETALGGEQLRKLDPVLARGSAGFDQLANSISGTSDMLSDQQIQNAAATANKLKLLGDQLQRDLSGFVANNAKAIEALATSFFRLADNAIKAFNAMQRYGARAILNNPFASDEDKKYAQGFINSTATGRRESRQQILVAMGAIDTAAEDAANPKTLKYSSFPVNGIGEVKNTPQGRAAAKRALEGQLRELDAAEKADNAANIAAPVQTGKVGNTSNIFSPKGPKGRSAASLDAEAQERTKRFNDQLAGFQEEELRAQESLTGDLQKQADIEAEIADRALKRQLADIESDRKKNIDKGEPAKEANARASALAAAARIAHDTQKQARDQQTLADIAHAQLAHLETRLGIESDLLSSQLSLAKTAKERRDIELRLLDIAQREEKARLEGQLKTLKPGDPAREDVQKQIEALPAKRAGAEADINRRDAGPFQEYLQSLPSTGKQIEESFERAAVNGVERLNDSLATSLSTMLGLHGAAGEFLADLIKIGIQAAEVALFGNGSQPGIGGAAGSVGQAGGFFSSLGAILGGTRASGGPVVGGKAYLVGENGPEIVHMGGSGTVYPNGALPNLMGGGGGTTIIQKFTLDARYGITTPELLQHVNTVASQRAQEAGQASYRASVAAVPSAMSKYQNEKG